MTPGIFRIVDKTKEPDSSISYQLKERKKTLWRYVNDKDGALLLYFGQFFSPLSSIFFLKFMRWTCAAVASTAIKSTHTEITYHLGSVINMIYFIIGAAIWISYAVARFYGQQSRWKQCAHCCCNLIGPINIANYYSIRSRSSCHRHLMFR